MWKTDGYLLAIDVSLSVACAKGAAPHVTRSRARRHSMLSRLWSWVTCGVHVRIERYRGVQK